MVPLVGAVAIIVVPVVLVVLGIVVGGAVVPVWAVAIIVVPVVLVALGIELVALGIELVAVGIIVVWLVRIAVGAAVVLVAFGIDVVTRCPVARTTALPCRARPGACLAVSGPEAANAELVASATPSRPAAAATPSLMEVFMSVPFS